MHQTMSAVSLFTFSVPPILPEGEPPLDPSIGFLPPNNGTTGQGFVSFTVRADQQVPSLSTIDAKASIVFDQNEPIETPPIFNTVSSFGRNICAMYYVLHILFVLVHIELYCLIFVHGLVVK